jgi:hypothetical protein
MILLATYLVIAAIGQALNVALAVQMEKYAPGVALALFFILFVLIFIAGWILAVRLTEPKKAAAGQ